MRRPNKCEKHQNYKYMNFCPFCSITADRDSLKLAYEELKAKDTQAQATIERQDAVLRKVRNSIAIASWNVKPEFQQWAKDMTAELDAILNGEK